jgi:hypothetical protein
MPQKLTDAMIEALPPLNGASATRLIWDTEVTGFGVRIFPPTRTNPTGTRSFFLN